MENSQFAKGKGQILTEYVRLRAKLGNTVAGRGFSYEPGFMYDAQNEIETDAKFKLSELNYSLLQTAIERELKQTGLDYDLAFKNAVIVWEQEKQSLIADLDREISMSKQAMAGDDELLRILAIEVSKRSSALLEARTAIELQAEALRLQLEQLDDGASAYEIQLANAKVVTARKKLEVIPYIEQIIAIELQIIDAEYQIMAKTGEVVSKAGEAIAVETLITDKEMQIVTKQSEVLDEEFVLLDLNRDVLTAREARISAETDLVAAEQAAMDLRESLVRPALEDMLTIMDEYIDELTVQLALYNDIADIKTETVAIKEQQAAKQDEILSKRRTITDAMGQVTALLSGLTDYKMAELAPLISELMETYDRYADSIEEQTALRVAIAETRALIAGLIPQQVAGELSISDAKISLENQRAALDAAKLALQLQDSLNRVARIAQENTYSIDFATRWGEAQADILTQRESTFNTTDSLARQIEAKELGINVANKLRVDGEEQASIYTKANMYENYKTRDAEIRTNARGITARLTHLLKQD